MTTITISGSTIGSKTVLAPSTIDPYAPISVFGRHIPIDGATILDVSDNTDSYGDKNAQRFMTWEVLPSTDSNWTMTVNELKSLEGTDAVLNATGCSAYTTTQNIRVENVQMAFIKQNSTIQYYSVTLTYSHR